MDLNLKDKVAIITASGMGIGKATALTLAREGARVVINDISKDSAESAVAEIKKHGVESYYVLGDASDEKVVEEIVDFTIKKFGRIDILINNVGIGVISPIWEMETSDWKKVIDVNLNSYFIASKHVLRQMINQKYGKIVSISSCDRIYSTTEFPASSYTASKAAVAGFTRAMAQEAAPYGINVNCIAPGHTAVERVREGRGTPGDEDSEPIDWGKVERTLFPKILFGRWAEPEEIANAIVFLCSDAASFITGATLDVNGGIVMV